MKKTIMIAAAMLTMSWGADASTAPQSPSATPAGQGKMRQMPVFAKCDLNNDGKISQSEFDETRAKRMSKRAAEGRMLKNTGNAPTFSQIDTDKDSFISPEEFKVHRANRLESRITDAFQRMDSDKSGQVTLEEFRAFRMQQMQNRRKGMMQGHNKCGAN